MTGQLTQLITLPKMVLIIFRALSRKIWTRNHNLWLVKAAIPKLTGVNEHSRQDVDRREIRELALTRGQDIFKCRDVNSPKKGSRIYEVVEREL